MLKIKNKHNQWANIIDIGKANYSKIYVIDKEIKDCSVVADNGLKFYFWQKDIDNGIADLVEKGGIDMLETQDSLQYLKTKQDYEFDIMYSDPPYALGSEVIIRQDGRVDYKKANDFMNKWEMPTGEYWEQWFKEAYRTLKYGGYCIMFGMDRQLLLFKYYAKLAGFEEHQSLYWYFISNFPKATDLSKQIDKSMNAERIGSGILKTHAKKGVSVAEERTTIGAGAFGGKRTTEITLPSTELAKKYDGYKYSISPLKQTNETIMIFHKPYKTGSCLHDTLAYENGDKTITCGALNIDGNRCDFQSEEDKKESTTKNQHENFGTKPMTNNNCYGDYSMIEPKNYNPTGRYPAQTYCNDLTAEVLGEPSKILHKCNYEQEDHDLYFYNPKVSKSERNAGCDEFENRVSHLNSGGIGRESSVEKRLETNGENAPTTKNNHPTLKPIALNEKILKLFKTPNEQKIIYPFAGSGSEIIGGIKAGFKNWCGCELSQEYVDIANARIKYWTTQNKQATIDDFLEKGE